MALLSLSAFPLIGASLKSYQYQKEQLFTLELERQAELHFYQILKESVGHLHFGELSSKPSIKTPLKDLELSLGGVKKTYYPHYHLYYSANAKSPTHKKLFCAICFPTQKHCCPNSRKDPSKKNVYLFCFLAKRVVEN